MNLQKREKILLAITAVVLLALAGRDRLKSTFLSPIQDRQARLQALEKEQTEKTEALVQVKQAAAELRTYRGRSLPPNPYDAQRLYQQWLTDTALMAGLDDPKIVPSRRNPKGGLYTAVLVSVDAQARFEALSRFLYYFYRTDLAHRISSMTIEPQGNEGNPLFNLSLTAEGLAFSGAENRRVLFPQTVLKSDFRSQQQKQTIQVDDASGFPSEEQFRVRIGEEYLTVTGVEGNRWEVVGGADGTTPARHEADEVVELAPIHPDFADRTLEDIRALTADSLFVKPTDGASPSPVRPQPGPRIVSSRDEAAETVLTGCVAVDGVWEAWLDMPGESETTKLRKGSSVSISDIQGEVVEVGFDHLLLRTGDGTWRLRLGENLRGMERIAEPAAADGGEKSEKISDSGAISQSPTTTADR